MKFSLDDPAFLTLLLVAVVLFAIALIAVAVFLVLKSRKKGEKKPEESKPGILKRLFPPRVPGMAESFREAMRQLKEKLPEWDYRYKVPWYVLVGESGSGKSTVAYALSATEVVSPEIAEYAPRWLLLDQAVLIDLPGKAFLATEPTPAPPSAITSLLDDDKKDAEKAWSPDRNAWRSFLRLTARYRPRQPLNGIVLTIPASELLQSDTDPERPERRLRVDDLAQRLNEIQHLARLSLPVYVLVTKCDAVTGFSSYSRSVFREAVLERSANNGVREEISDDLFGWSNPYSLDSAFTPVWVDEAFDQTNEVLLQRQLEMLAESKTVADADGVFLFPFELQRLKEPLRVVLDHVFRTTAYHSSHLLRGIYFCGRESPSNSELPAPQAPPSDDLPAQRRYLGAASDRVLFVRNLFEFKVFRERYLAAPVSNAFFSGNRSVRLAQITAVALVLILSLASIRALNRIAGLQRNRINPVLTSLSMSLDNVTAASGTSVGPAVELINSLGAAREEEYYSLALPYSYVDLGGLHRRLNDTLEGAFEVVVLSSSKSALQDRISMLLNSGAGNPVTNNQQSAYPPGTAWSTDPAYSLLRGYLHDVAALRTNIARYELISSPGSGSFHQLNQLLQYLGARNLPDSGRFAQDATYQRRLLDAIWYPLYVPPDFDKKTSDDTKKAIANFYQSWFDSNPLKDEVKGLADSLQALTAQGAAPSNDQLRGIVSRAQAIDTQLQSGTFDWLAENFNRESYPALGPELNQMPFADSQFTDAVTIQGSEKLAGLKAAVQTTPAVLDFSDGKVRLTGEVRTLASVLDSLLDYEIMADKNGSCHLIPSGTVWNSSDLSAALRMDAQRNKIESELLPSLPGEYRSVVQSLVDRRTANVMSSLLENAATPNPNQGEPQAALDAELQNLNQSLDNLKQIEDSLSTLHATAERSCLNNALVRQANSLLIRINQQLPRLYSHAALTGPAEANGPPVSQWLYGVTSTEDLQAYLAAERKKIETLSAEAAPLVQLLRAAGSRSEPLTRWHGISQDVEALQAKTPDNPIQTLETFISTGLDKITPEANCKGVAIHRTSDAFLSVQADLSRIAVDHCYTVAVSRFNEIASVFNKRLAGHFPFSQLVDFRSGEAQPGDDPATDPTDNSPYIGEFYKVVDKDAAGLEKVLPNAADKPDAAVAFLKAVANARPVVTGTPKSPNPVFGLGVIFRVNRSQEVYGNRIVDWTLNVGQQTLHSRPAPGDTPVPTWTFNQPVSLTLLYANNAAESPSSKNPSSAATVQGKSITFSYNNAWSLLAFFRDHPPASTSDADKDQYTIVIPNISSSSAGPPPSTVVYIQVDVLQIGAKPGDPALQVPVFRFNAPTVALKSASGE